MLSSSWHPLCLQQSPLPLVHVHGSYILVLWLLHFLYYSYPPPVYFVPNNYASYCLYLFLLSPPPSHISPCSSCPWVISSLTSTFPILFLSSPCLFSTYHLCYLFSVPFPPSPPPTPLLITLHVNSISVVPFLF